jgi:sugar lactone lactonase YvrE
MTRYPYFLLAAIFTIGQYRSAAQTIITYAGNGTPGYIGDNGPATAAEIKSIQLLATDRNGNLYIADQGNHCVRKVNSSGVISTFAGSTTALVLGDGGPATAASLNAPSAVAVDAAGNVYIADANDNRVRKVNTTGIISTVAGIGGLAGSLGDNGPATAAELGQPQALAIDSRGYIYIAEVGNNKVRVVNTAGIISTFTGTGAAGSTGDGSPATAAQVNFPSGLAVDTAGNVFIADMGNSKVREVLKSTGHIITFAGTGAPGYYGDGGLADTCKLRAPQGLAFDPWGNLYIGEFSSFCIRRISMSSTIITTVAGTGTMGSTGDNGPATAALLSAPRHAVFDTLGNMYIADANNNKIRKVTPIPSVLILDNLAPLCVGHTNSLSDAIAGGTWTSSSTTIATIGSSSGIVTGVSAGTASITYKTPTDYATSVVTVSTCTSHTEVGSTQSVANKLEIVPNPNSGSFKLLLSSAIDEPALITISNMIGVKIKQVQSFTNAKVDVQLESPAGVYLLTVSTSSGKWSERVTLLH